MSAPVLALPHVALATLSAGLLTELLKYKTVSPKPWILPAADGIG